MNPNDKKTQSIDTSSRVTEKITLVDTDTESTVINIFYMFKKVNMNMLKRDKEKRKIQIASLDIKKKSEHEIKNTLGELNTRLDTAGGKKKVNFKT